MLGRCFGETDRGLPAAPSGCLGWIFLPLETSSRNLLTEFHRTVVKVPWTGFGTSPDASFEVFLSPSIGASSGCAHGGGGVTSERLLEGGYAFLRRCF